jgi:hypothetical protein
MSELGITLTDKDKAYVKLLASHTQQFQHLLNDLGSSEPLPDGQQAPLTREIALANTKLEEAYFWAREHVWRAAAKRNQVN